MYHGAESIGNILADDWEYLWDKLKLWRSDEILPNECRECAVIGECGGGCRISAKTISGTIYGKDPYMEKCISEKVWNDVMNQSHFDINACDSYIDGVSPNKISYETGFRISQEVIDRREPFGGTLFIGSRAVFLKKDSYQLYIRLKAMDHLTQQVLKRNSA